MDRGLLYSELPVKVRQLVLYQWSTRELDEDYYEDVTDTIITFLQLTGWGGVQNGYVGIRWSGFGCQGDGACIVGKWRYKENWFSRFLDEFGEGARWKPYLKSILGMERIQRKWFYSLEVELTHSSHYNHHKSVIIGVRDLINDRSVPEDVLEEMTGYVEDLMLEIYRRLEEENDWFRSEEGLIEQLYRYNEKGERIH